jgi:adenosine kinase
MPDKSRRILVTGSLAWDQIMDFPGNFKDHILPDKAHVISISFLVGELKKQRGGCSANIAYSLALLEEKPVVLAAAGSDFSDYRAFLDANGVDTRAIRSFENELTASCFITTDKVDNQITGFFPGAMKRAGELSVAKDVQGERPVMAIISPDDPSAMVRHPRECREMGIPFLYDPSFQVTAMDGPALLEGARGAKAIMLNDYETAVFQEKTKLTADGLLDLAELVVVTLGDKGSEIRRKGKAPILVPIAKVEKVIDPTGAGDAYRAGFVSGLVRGFSLESCGRMGSVAAVYAVENYGTQQHRYTRAAFLERYKQNFGSAPA